MNAILRAARFAREAHASQRRRYTRRPYIEHPGRVAARVCTHPLATEAMVVAAWLHDVVEDTGVDLPTIAAAFGDEVAGLVAALTNPSHGSAAPRTERKARDREHLACTSAPVKIIKLIDRIDNLREMAGAPARFARLYATESLLLAGAIGDADPVLRQELVDEANALLERSSSRVEEGDRQTKDGPHP